MTRAKQIRHLIVVFGGFAILIAAFVLLWNRYVTALDLTLFFAMYVLTALGITVGFHRLLAHRSFQTYRPIKYAFAVLGALSVQGPLLDWVSDHRKHHAYSDREGDPHSPHIGHGDGWLAALRGFWHSHVGWIYRTQGGADRHEYCKDLLRDKGIVFIDRTARLFYLLSLAIPFALGAAITDSVRGGWSAMFWAGFVRIYFTHHVTFSVNSVCHCFGTQPLRADDHSGNVFWLSLLTMGESWHRNHHVFPRSAFHGFRWWQLDPSGLLIRAMALCGLAWGLVEIPRAMQDRMLAPALQTRATGS